MPKTVVHIVKKGENLDRIARSYGLKSFKTIYADPVNAKFRKTRPKPDLIQPGDKIIIPNYALTPEKRKNLKSLISTIEKRVMSLEARKKELEKSTSASISEVKALKRSFSKTANGVDAAALVLTLFASLAKIGHAGLKATSQTGAELAKTNKKVLGDIADMHLTAVEPALQAGAKSMSDSSSRNIAALGIVADSFFNLTSPSFWGKTYIKARDEGMLKKIASGKFGEGWDAWSRAVTWDPQKEFDTMARSMTTQAAKITKQIDILIAEDKEILSSLRNIARK